jgi:hypothetical protein
MKRLLLATGGALLIALAVVASVAAADPTQQRDRDTLAGVLGLNQGRIVALRHDGLSLAEIAARQHVATQRVVDALEARWTAGLQARVENGALTEAEAAQLRTRLDTQAQAMVQQTSPGGMQGAAVGAGNGNGPGTGNGYGPGDGTGAGTGPADGTGNGPGPHGDGDGDCDGSGPHGPGQP